MAMTQQELTPRASAAADELEELYEEEPRRRAWGAIASVVLTLALIFVGYQWHQTTERGELLASQVRALRGDTEKARLRAEDAQRQVDGLQARLAMVSAERDALAERVGALEKVAQQRVTAAKDGTREAGRPRATQVAAKKIR